MAGITRSLRLKGQTATSLRAFKKRNEDPRRKVAVLREQPMGQLKIIEGFEAEAVRTVEAAKGRVDNELGFGKTLGNIGEARPCENLTCARPDIDSRTAEMVAEGRWMPAGYKGGFGELSIFKWAK
ncbi:hypothetical protein C7212DRAFT_351378 [Tuber magnatum]|uniref:Uncharacterized protein n=1 Tax=Tuber magnatum TaxID=42249 RepID=A0A317SV07_9PEZI|nr:hypothetical protein C7212DRAFT_351378 [Tuber magnatum]